MKANFSMLLMVVGLVSTTAVAQSNLPKGSYVVVAAFSPHHEDYAIRLSKGLSKEGLHTSYGFESARKYWYVYINHSADRDECINEVKKTRSESRFGDAWVHTIKDPDEVETAATEPEKQKTPDPIVEEPKKEEQKTNEEKKEKPN